eukprot:scaffold630_cov188-Ochromonas_danica.AAC.17
MNKEEKGDSKQVLIIYSAKEDGCQGRKGSRRILLSHCSNNSIWNPWNDGGRRKSELKLGIVEIGLAGGVCHKARHRLSSVSLGGQGKD